ncbi:MAG: 5'-methylthioadenosine/adenosylhomocysteine nucleosidase [Tissierellia bacterium]|nr:5'-methylthioadenosine/adenosylhomocysteine nucleosidase [Bacillota bacterium]NLL22456.1 5'-methylthioadenosine/adenosylhomocysteine nucleosidase [Tissierellia bacterium]
MTIGILAALKVELLDLLENREQIEEKTIADSTFFLFEDGEHTLVLCEAGVGKINAAMVTQQMIDHFDPDILINTGIAGSLQPYVHVMDTVLATDATLHDLDHRIMRSFKPFQDHFIADEKILDGLKAAAAELGLSVHTGRILTGDVFVNDLSLKKNLAEKYEGLCVEMEGAAIAQVAVRNNIPFGIVRTISDEADHEADISYDQFEEIAARRSAALLRQFVQSFS